MYNNYYRQNASNTIPNELTNNETYPLMQEIISSIVELYHKEHKNLDMYQSLLELSSNMEYEEIILDIIEQTTDNVRYLSQMYLGFTGDTVDQLTLPQSDIPSLSFLELLKNTLFSKIDTLKQYESLYTTIPIQPYKDILLEIIIGQLKDATFSNYLISSQAFL